MKKLSDEQIKKIKELRRAGLTIRQIATRIKMSPGTVFYYARSVKEVGHRKRAFKLIKQEIDTTEGIETTIYKIEGIEVALIHLPFIVICSDCKKEENHIWLCLDCGTFFCTSCGNDVNLKTLSRKEELLG